MRRRYVIAAAVVVLLVGLVVRVVSAESLTKQTGNREFCFAEWCVQPVQVSLSDATVTVAVRVRSDAKSVSQRPDHAQAWIVGSSNTPVGGPQSGLDRLIGPGESYIATLTFDIAVPPGSCPRLLVSEGGWPPFLGLGYAPSPFTERVQWNLCAV